MAFLDFLKPRWSSGSMTSEDRRRIFWYLKRKTSYTAWRRASDRFSRFMEILEKQIKEEPSPIGFWGSEIEWKRAHVGAVKATVHYRNGLVRLKQGDKNGLLYNYFGELRDAWLTAGEWHSEIVNGGHEMDPRRWEGKYLDEMQRALRWFFLASSDTGYVQPKMAGLSAVEVWEKERHAELLTLPHSSSIADVPPATDILIHTDEVAPVFGIYEPQVRDGCMNYLLGSVPARSYSKTPVSRDGESVFWRLIWKDDRYEDGTIPDEEKDYFPVELEQQSKSEIERSRLEDELVVAFSRNMAPRAGRWLLKDDLKVTIEVTRKGDLLPLHQDREVTWIWADGDPVKVSAFSENRS